MGLERVQFPRLRGDQLVHRTQALGDFLLFGWAWSWDFDAKERLFADVQQAIAPRSARDVPLELPAMLVLLKAVLKEAVRVAIFQSETDEDIWRGNLPPSLQKVNAAFGELERVAFVKNKVAITD